MSGENSNGWVEGRKNKTVNVTTQGPIKNTLSPILLYWLLKRHSFPPWNNPATLGTWICGKDARTKTSKQIFSQMVVVVHGDFHPMVKSESAKKSPTKQNPRAGFPSPTHRIHGISIKINLNIGKKSIHGSYGLQKINQSNCFSVTTSPLPRFHHHGCPTRNPPGRLLTPPQKRWLWT